MARKREPFGQHPVQPARASLHIEHPVAPVAMEMMMVLLRDRRELVPVGLAWHRDRCDLSLLQESIDNPVHGPYTKARHVLNREPMDLINRKRTTR